MFKVIVLHMNTVSIYTIVLGMLADWVLHRLSGAGSKWKSNGRESKEQTEKRQCRMAEWRMRKRKRETEGWRGAVCTRGGGEKQ